MKGSTSERTEAPEESQVVNLIHPKAEPVPLSIGSGAGGIVRRSGFRSAMDDPAPLAFVRPPAAPREVRLNGFPGVLAEVPRHRCDDGGRRVPDAAPKGGSVAAYVAKPAYPVPLMYPFERVSR